MEEKILKLSSAVFTLMIAGAVVILGQFSVVNKREAKREQMSELQMLAYYTEQARQVDVFFHNSLFNSARRASAMAGINHNYLIIHLPGGKKIHIQKSFFYCSFHLVNSVHGNLNHAVFHIQIIDVIASAQQRMLPEIIFPHIRNPNGNQLFYNRGQQSHL